jgi:hypothetical protein
MAQFPFATKPTAPAETATTEPIAEGAATEEVQAAPAEAAPKKTKKAKKDGRKKPAAQMTPEQVKEILGLVKTHSYPEIAEKVGVTKFQVNRVLMSTKKQLIESAGTDTAKLAKVQAYIAENLSRPEDARPGRGGKVKSALDDIVGDILNSL